MLPALPFLGAGVLLTVQRLRSARLPLWLAVLFVVPVLKWFLFLVALVTPSRQSIEPPPLPGLRPPTWLERLCPRSRLGSAAAGVAIACVLLWTATLMGTQALGQYGWGLFLGLPFVAGFLGAFIHSAREPRSLTDSVMVALLAGVVGALGFLALAIEGFVCLIMAAPLVVPMAVMGALLGHVIAPARVRQAAGQMFCAGLLAVPLMLTGERLMDAPAPLLEVRSSVKVAAPPERVWRHVIAFAELPPPTEWLFRLGIAYPQRAEMFGTGQIGRAHV